MQTGFFLSDRKRDSHKPFSDYGCLCPLSFCPQIHLHTIPVTLQMILRHSQLRGLQGSPPGALKNILENRFENKRIILHAAGDERVIKEALWVLGACGYFDEIVIDGEGGEW